MDPDALNTFGGQLRTLQARICEAMERCEERGVYSGVSDDSSDLRCLQSIRGELDNMTCQVNRLREWSIEETTKQADLVKHLMTTRHQLLESIQGSLPQMHVEKAVVEEALAFVDLGAQEAESVGCTSPTSSDRSRGSAVSRISGATVPSQRSVAPQHPVVAPQPEPWEREESTSHTQEAIHKGTFKGVYVEASISASIPTPEEHRVYGGVTGEHVRKGSVASMLDIETEQEISFLSNPAKVRKHYGMTLSGLPSDYGNDLFPAPSTPAQERYQQGYRSRRPVYKDASKDQHYSEFESVAPSGVWPTQRVTSVMALKTSAPQAEEMVTKGAETKSLETLSWRDARLAPAHPADSPDCDPPSEPPTHGFASALVKCAAALLLGKAVHESHRSGRLEPAMRVAFENTKAFLGNVSTKVKASGSQQWRSQAPRVGRLLAALRIKIKSRLAGRGRDARRAMSKPTTLPKHKSPVPPTPPAPRVMHSANMRVTTHQHVEFAAPLVEQCDLSLPRENCNVLNGRG